MFWLILILDQIFKLVRIDDGKANGIFTLRRIHYPSA